MTSPPKPFEANWLTRLWLELWFSDHSAAEIEKSLSFGMRIGGWENFMNEVLLEAARVVRPAGKALIACAKPSGRAEAQGWSAREALEKVVEDHLSSYWELEGFLSVSDTQKTVTGHAKKKRSRYDSPNGILVLRRS